MAPPRGPRGGATRANRGQPSSRPTDRGGIQKRKAAGTRQDIDGDLDMDSEGRRTKRLAAGGAGASRTTRSTRSSTTTQARPSRQAANLARHLNGGNSLVSRVSTRGSQKTIPGLVWLQVKGLKESKAASNPGGGVRDLLQFLERKATTAAHRASTKPIAIKQHRVQGELVLVGASKEDSEEILKLNGFLFAGANVEISLKEESSTTSETSAHAQLLKDHLRSILSTRYDGATKLLKLDALSADPAIAETGLLSSSERAEKMFRALMKVCDELFKTRKDKSEAIESISVASNNIDNLNQVLVLADTFPDLHNLNLSGNSLSSIDGLKGLKGKFRELRALYLTENPIETAQPEYKATILEWFPTLLDLNGIQVRTPEQAAAAVAATLPQSFPQNGPDFRDANAIGENFLLDFFTNYDNNRASLVSKYYDQSSSFSLAVDTNSPRDPSLPAPLPWAAYLKYSRNLTKITHTGPRIQRLFKGANLISELWQGLPPSKHPDLKQEVNKYIMDCHGLPGLADPNGQNLRGVDGLIITIHGEFDEFDEKSGTTGKRSFSRTFVLGPGLPGKTPIRVVSDMVTLRAHTPLPDVFGAPASAPGTTDNAQAEQHAAMVAELAKQTGMTPVYAEMCLSDASVGWNFEKALAIFNERKAQLPADAFVAGVGVNI
ncbi:related to mRNA export factor MEX67 [Cephalotrichum gorgonifer]|uniref:Related to mRNA export factor MEX67 n=1 Tax=Cephalotrichum gorgonifer TaxID=2041049 RepID=A0AAE8MSA8_9PEZI|nr:related to mRNA export factor MEX67 [Cephalotrichum gorgonifer]